MESSPPEHATITPLNDWILSFSLSRILTSKLLLLLAIRLTFPLSKAKSAFFCVLPNLIKVFRKKFERVNDFLGVEKIANVI